MSRIIKSSKVVEERGDSLIKKTNNREEEILLKNAKKKYDEIVFAARSEAEKIIKSGHKERESILNIAYREAENISNKWKDKGYQEGIKSGHTEGYDDGYEEGRRDSNILIDEALEIKEEYIKKKENLYREVEEDIIHLVLDISEKVIYDKINEDMLILRYYKQIQLYKRSLEKLVGDKKPIHAYLYYFNWKGGAIKVDV